MRDCGLAMNVAVGPGNAAAGGCQPYIYCQYATICVKMSTESFTVLNQENDIGFISWANGR